MKRKTEKLRRKTIRWVKYKIGGGRSDVRIGRSPRKNLDITHGMNRGPGIWADRTHL